MRGDIFKNNPGASIGVHHYVQNANTSSSMTVAQPAATSTPLGLPFDPLLMHRIDSRLDTILTKVGVDWRSRGWNSECGHNDKQIIMERNLNDDRWLFCCCVYCVSWTASLTRTMSARWCRRLRGEQWQPSRCSAATLTAASTSFSRSWASWTSPLLRASTATELPIHISHINAEGREGRDGGRGGREEGVAVAASVGRASEVMSVHRCRRIVERVQD